MTQQKYCPPEKCRQHSSKTQNAGVQPQCSVLVVHRYRSEPQEELKDLAHLTLRGEGGIYFVQLSLCLSKPERQEGEENSNPILCVCLSLTWRTLVVNLPTKNGESHRMSDHGRRRGRRGYR